MNIFEQAVAELEEIESKISSLSKRREQLRAFVTIGSSLYPTEASSVEAPRLSLMQRSALTGERDATVGTAKSAIVDATREILLEKVSVHTRDLVPMLEARGIEIAGQDKNSTVSVILSKSGLFQSSRRFGWSLASTEEKPPLGVDAPAGAV